MRLMHWNCQGLRNNLTVPILKDIRKCYNPDIIFLVETKNCNSYVEDLGKALGYAHNFVVSPSGLSGGMAIFWKNEIDCKIVGRPSLYLTNMYITDNDKTIFCSYVYGHPIRKYRLKQWQWIINQNETGTSKTYPRLMLGDFNDIKDSSEKLGGSKRADYTYEPFKKFLSTLGLHDIKLLGGKYTWKGNRYSHHVRSKIDRMVANAEWQNQFPDAYIQALQWIGSDHRPLLLHTDCKKIKGSKFFKYDSRWRYIPEVKQVIKQTWENECIQEPASNFHKALKKCRGKISHWLSLNSRNSKKHIEELKEKINKAHDQFPPDLSLIKTLEEELDFHYKMEEEFWRNKSRIQWLQAGDKNTRYFHEKCKQRRNYNRITALQDQTGKIKFEQEEIKEIIAEYFKALYQTESSPATWPQLPRIDRRVSPEMNHSLTKPITDQEIAAAIKSMHPDKAPGPDGFTARFYQDHWHTISKSVIQFVKNFFETGQMDSDINQTNICLDGGRVAPRYPNRGVE